MDEERGGLPSPVPRRPMSAPTALLGILVAVSMSPSIAADEASIGLAEAAEQGTFNVGTAHAVVARVSDPDAGGEVLKLTYTIPRGTTAGVYAKGFPPSCERIASTSCEWVSRRATPEQGRQVTAAIEIKGSAGLQRIALELQPDWHPSEQTIDWPAIGTVKEVVVLVNGISDREPATGTLLIDARFEQLSPLRRLSMSLAARFGGVILAGLALSFLAGLLGASGRRSRRVAETGAEERREPFPAPPQSAVRLLLADLIQGVGVVLIALLVVETYVLGGRGRLETGWTALGLAIAGAAVAEWWKFGLTGKHLTGVEVFQDVLASGLLATSSSPLAILQAPASWSDLLLLSQPVAAACMLLYHTVNAYRLATSGRHLTATAALADRRDALHRRRLGPAGVGRPDANTGWHAHGRARVVTARGDGVPRARLRRFLLQRGGRPGARAGNEGQERSVPSGPISPCWPSPLPSSPLPSPPRSGRDRPSPHGPACSAWSPPC